MTTTSTPTILTVSTLALLALGGCYPDSAPPRTDAGDVAPGSDATETENCNPDQMCVGCDAAKDCTGSAEQFCDEQGEEVTTQRRRLFCEDCHAKVRSETKDAGETIGSRWLAPPTRPTTVAATTHVPALPFDRSSLRVRP